jgi:hypothetical protein
VIAHSLEELRLLDKVGCRKVILFNGYEDEEGTAKPMKYFEENAHITYNTKNIEMMFISKDFNNVDYLPQHFIPSSVESLAFDEGFDVKNIAKGAFPTNLRHLHFFGPYQHHKSFIWGSLPHELKTLGICTADPLTKCRVNVHMLPNSLNMLRIGGDVIHGSGMRDMLRKRKDVKKYYISNNVL